MIMKQGLTNHHHPSRLCLEDPINRDQLAKIKYPNNQPWTSLTTIPIIKTNSRERSNHNQPRKWPSWKEPCKNIINHQKEITLKIVLVAVEMNIFHKILESQVPLKTLKNLSNKIQYKSRIKNKVAFCKMQVVPQIKKNFHQTQVVMSNKCSKCKIKELEISKENMRRIKG